MTKIEIDNQKVIEEIVCTFARKPKTTVKHIRIFDRTTNDNQVAEVIYYDGKQRYFCEHDCLADVIIQDNASYLRFHCCNTKKTVVIKI